MAELLFKNKIYKIIGAAKEVHKAFGQGSVEEVYQKALAIEFGSRNIPYIENPHFEFGHKGFTLKRKQISDFLCFDEILVEIRAVKQCGINEENHIINALNLTGKEIGVLINFGEPELFWKPFLKTK